MPETFNFDFRKEEDRKQFYELDVSDRQTVIDHARIEADALRKSANEIRQRRGAEETAAEDYQAALELQENEALKKEVLESFMQSSIDMFIDRIYDKKMIETLCKCEMTKEQETLSYDFARRFEMYFVSGGHKEYLDVALGLCKQIPQDMYREIVRSVFSFNLAMMSCGSHKYKGLFNQSDEQRIREVILKAKEELQMSDEYLQQASLEAVFYSLYEGNTQGYCDLKQFIGVPDWVRDIPQMKHGALIHITHNVRMAEELRKEYDLQDDDFFEALTIGTARDMASNQRRVEPKQLFKDDLNVPAEYESRCVELGIILSLNDGSITNTLEIIRNFEVGNGVLAKSEIQEAAKKALYRQIEKKNGAKFSEVLAGLNMRRADVSDTLKRAMNGGIEEKVIMILDDIPSQCLEAIDKEYGLLFYKDNIGIPSVTFYAPYKKIFQERDAIKLEGYASQFRERVNTFVSSETQPEDISRQEGYKELIELIFSNNAERVTNFTDNESCKDRSGDIADYVIRTVYEIRLGKGSEMILREGLERDEHALAVVESDIVSVQAEFEKAGFERAKILEILDTKIDEGMKGVVSADAFQEREERIFVLILENMVGKLSDEKLKEVLIAYHFAVDEDIRAYLEATGDRVGQSKNKDYAHLGELREFFADRMVDVMRNIVSAQKNQDVLNALPQYYSDKRTLEDVSRAQDAINRANIRYADYSRRLDEQRRKGNDRAVAATILGEQKKIAGLIHEVTGAVVDPETVDVASFNVDDLRNHDAAGYGGEYDEDLFAQYVLITSQRVFDDEIALIDKELAKYRPRDEEKKRKQYRQLECFITKNHTSAHARSVGGVCVAADNPTRGEDCIWNLPNYFQFVLRDKTTKICQGLVLLHSFEDDGKRILTASFNPSSTYLYKVDEAELFNGLLKQLTVFAEDNDFDIVATSDGHGIRTNRTGGEFETAMKKRIGEVNTKITLSEEKTFSFRPHYTLHTLDAVWVNKKGGTQ